MVDFCACLAIPPNRLVGNISGVRDGTGKKTVQLLKTENKTLTISSAVRGAKCCCSMSVCLSAHISKTTSWNLLCYPWPWLGPPLIIVQYVMYFWFCGWRHVFTYRYRLAVCEIASYSSWLPRWLHLLLAPMGKVRSCQLPRLTAAC